MCMQYESNPANGFRDIVRKQNTDARPDKVMTISPAPTSWAGDKKWTFCIEMGLHNRNTPKYVMGQAPSIWCISKYRYCNDHII